MNILPVEGAVVPAVTKSTPAMSLTDRFAEAWANAYADSGAELAAIRAASNDPRTSSSPEDLIRLQESLQEYTKQMTITAGLVNHVVKTADTLLKS
jgi:hypothetical protein